MNFACYESAMVVFSVNKLQQFLTQSLQSHQMYRNYTTSPLCGTTLLVVELALPVFPMLLVLGVQWALHKSLEVGTQMWHPVSRSDSEQTFQSPRHGLQSLQ